MNNKIQFVFNNTKEHKNTLRLSVSKLRQTPDRIDKYE